MSSIAVNSWHESMQLQLHSMDLAHDFLQCVVRFCFTSLFLSVLGRAVTRILGTICLNIILADNIVFRVSRLHRITNRFQHAIDVLDCCKAICRSSVAGIDYVRNPDRHS